MDKVTREMLEVLSRSDAVDVESIVHVVWRTNPAIQMHHGKKMLFEEL